MVSEPTVRLPLRGNVRIAIHQRSGSFSARFTQACQELRIPFSQVDGYENGVVRLLRGHSHFIWHYDHEDPRDRLAAPAVLATASRMGLTVFPDYNTRWHFNDKVAQKYLFEATGLPAPTTKVFYSEQDALASCRDIRFPVVAKLRSGAGSANVKLIRSSQEARRYIKMMFRKGLQPVPAYTSDLRAKLRRIHSLKQLLPRLRRFPDRFAYRALVRKSTPAERGYVLFQEFLPGANHDTRVTVIGDYAWGFRRRVRPGDFRASGSGEILYDPIALDPECVRLGFRAARALRMQSCAIDLVHDQFSRPLIIEASYGFLPSVVHGAPGRWHVSRGWEDGHFHPEDAILDVLLSEAASRDTKPLGINSPCI